MIAALGLLKFVPDLIGLFGGSKAKQVTEIVSSAAMAITGKQSVDAAEQALSADPDLAFKFKLAVMDDKTVIERLDEQSRQRASDQYKTHHEQADAIAQSIMSRNLIIIGILVIANALTVYLFTRFEVDQIGQLAVISNLIGVVIGALLQERQAVVSFFFGSSLGSKIKSALGASK